LNAVAEPTPPTFDSREQRQALPICRRSHQSKGRPALSSCCGSCWPSAWQVPPVGTLWLRTVRLHHAHKWCRYPSQCAAPPCAAFLFVGLGVTRPSGLRSTRVLTGCAFVLSERTPSTTDANPTCAALHTIAGMGNFVRTVHMDEEVRVTLKDFLKTLKSQMATIAELKQCQALTPSVPPSNSASLPRGIEGGSPCDCDANQAACTGTAHVRDARGLQTKARRRWRWRPFWTLPLHPTALRTKQVRRAARLLRAESRAAAAHSSGSHA
jgi:hypothetical protein